MTLASASSPAPCDQHARIRPCAGSDRRPRCALQLGQRAVEHGLEQLGQFAREHRVALVAERPSPCRPALPRCGARIRRTPACAVPRASRVRRSRRAPRLRRQEAFEHEAVARQPGDAQRGDAGARARHRPHRDPGRARGAHQPEARIADQRRAGIGHQRQRFARQQARDQLAGQLRPRCVRAAPAAAARAPKCASNWRVWRVSSAQIAATAAQRVQRARRQVAEVADRRGDDVERAGSTGEASGPCGEMRTSRLASTGGRVES